MSSSTVLPGSGTPLFLEIKPHFTDGEGYCVFNQPILYSKHVLSCQSRPLFLPRRNTAHTVLPEQMWPQTSEGSMAIQGMRKHSPLELRTHSNPVEAEPRHTAGFNMSSIGGAWDYFLAPPNPRSRIAKIPQKSHFSWRPEPSGRITALGPHQTRRLCCA